METNQIRVPSSNSLILQGRGAGMILPVTIPCRVRLDLGVATCCPETIFDHFLPKNPA
jgi:hypothetical protein